MRIRQGELFVWGGNTAMDCQCGFNDERNVLEPTKIAFHESIVMIAVGDEHTVFLTGKKNL